jgi:hypothetical protein
MGLSKAYKILSNDREWELYRNGNGNGVNKEWGGMGRSWGSHSIHVSPAYR